MSVLKLLDEETGSFVSIPTIKGEKGDKGDTGGNIDDVQVNGSSVVNNRIANIDLSGKADKTELPTKTSDLTNDSNFIDKDVNNLTNYYKKAEIDTSKQDTLVSGTNIKTVNNNSLLGSGNINLSGTTIPVSDTPPEDPENNSLWVDTDDDEHLAEVDDEVSTTSNNAVSNSAITNYVNEILKSIYSTDEIKTNKVWIDGKPIYRKTIIGVTATGTYDPQISDFDELVDVYGSVKIVNANWEPLPRGAIAGTETYSMTIGSVSGSSLYAEIGTFYTGKIEKSRVTIEYTKSTNTTTQTLNLESED